VQKRRASNQEYREHSVLGFSDGRSRTSITKTRNAIRGKTSLMFVRDEVGGALLISLYDWTITGKALLSDPASCPLF
jgi:hypothetical protein